MLKKQRLRFEIRRVRDSCRDKRVHFIINQGKFLVTKEFVRDKILFPLQQQIFLFNTQTGEILTRLILAL